MPIPPESGTYRRTVAVGPINPDPQQPDAILRTEMALLVLRAEAVNGSISPNTLRRLPLGVAIR